MAADELESKRLIVVGGVRRSAFEWVALNRERVDLALLVAAERHRDAAPQVQRFISVEDAFAGTATHRSCGVSGTLIESMRIFESRALLMIDRYNWSGESLAAVYRQYLRYLGEWDQVLSEVRPDAVLFLDAPHRGWDWVLWGLAKTRGIRAAFVSRTLFKNRVLIREDFDRVGPTREEIACESTKVEVNDQESLRRHISDRFSLYVTRVIPNLAAGGNLDVVQERSGIGTRVAHLLGRVFDRNILKMPDVIPGEHKRAVGYELFHRMQRIWVDGYLNRYRQISSKFSMPDQFVYFPLHVQPESTTLPLGGHHLDQLNAIELVASALPRGVHLVVREHPHIRLHRRQARRARDDNFLDRLSSFGPHVRVAPLSVPTELLGAKSLATATITGTPGWEAITTGKGAVILGSPWYKGAPGVTDFSEGLEPDGFGLAPNHWAHLAAYVDLMFKWHFRIGPENSLTDDSLSQDEQAAVGADFSLAVEEWASRASAPFSSERLLAPLLGVETA